MAVGFVSPRAGRQTRSFVKSPPKAAAFVTALKSAPVAPPVAPPAAAEDISGGQVAPMATGPAPDVNMSLPNPYSPMSAALEKNIKPLGDPSMLSAFVRGAQSFIDTRAARRQEQMQEARDRYAQEIQKQLDQFKLAQAAREQQSWASQDAQAAQQRQALGQFTQGMSGQQAAAALLDPSAAVGAYFAGQKPTTVPAGADVIQGGKLMYRNPREATQPYFPTQPPPPGFVPE